MKNNKLFVFAALLGTTLVACQKENKATDQPVVKKIATLSIQASMGKDAVDDENKALAIEDNALKAYWLADESVAVFYGSDTSIGSLMAGNITNNGLTAELTGNIDVSGLSNGSNTLSLLFPRSTWSYVGQDGTAPSENGSLATNYDYSLANLSVNYNSSTGSVTPSGSASFDNQQSIFQFRFNRTVDSFTLYSAQNKIVLSRSFDGSSWSSNYGSLSVNPGSYSPAAVDGKYYYYVAVRNENTSVDDRLYFSYLGDGGALYEASKSIPSSVLSAGAQFLAINVNLAQKSYAPSSDPSAPVIAEEIEVI